MGTKLQPGTFDCYENALPDEPMFVLLGRDKLAPFLVSIWAAIRMDDLEKAAVVFNTMAARASADFRAEPDVEKASEAMDCSAAMFEWRRANEGAWRAPISIETSTCGKEA